MKQATTRGTTGRGYLLAMEQTSGYADGSRASPLLAEGLF